MLHIFMQKAETQVPPFFFSGLFLDLIRFETPSAIHFSRSTSSSIGVHGIGGGLSYSLPFDFLFFLPVDTVMACGVDLRSLGLSELGLTDWAVFLAFCNSYANCEISKFSRTTLYSMIILPMYISTNVFSSQWS